MTNLRHLLLLPLAFAALLCDAQVVERGDTIASPANWMATDLHSSVDPALWLPVPRSRSTEPLKEPFVPYRSEADMLRARAEAAEKEAREKEEARLMAEKKQAEEAEMAAAGKVYQTGLATYYSPRTHGRMMADGTRYDKTKLFCAHRTLPFGTMVRVVNKKNGKEVVVTVRDRGPFVKGRVIDLSNKAAEQISMLSDGVVPVELYVVKTK